MVNNIITDSVWKKWRPKTIHSKNILNNYQDNDSCNKNNICQTMQYQKGFEAGLQEGYRLQLIKIDVEQKLKNKKIYYRMKNFVSSFELALQSINTTIIHKLLKIVLKIASKFFNYPKKINKNKILTTIQSVIKKEILSKNIKLKINVQDKNIVENYFGNILSSYNYSIECQDFIKPGECILEFENGELDTTVYSKWQNLCRFLYSGDH